MSSNEGIETYKISCLFYCLIRYSSLFLAPTTVMCNAACSQQLSEWPCLNRAFYFSPYELVLVFIESNARMTMWCPPVFHWHELWHQLSFVIVIASIRAMCQTLKDDVLVLSQWDEIVQMTTVLQHLKWITVFTSTTSLLQASILFWTVQQSRKYTCVPQFQFHWRVCLWHPGRSDTTSSEKSADTAEYTVRHSQLLLSALAVAQHPAITTNRCSPNPGCCIHRQSSWLLQWRSVWCLFTSHPLTSGGPERCRLSGDRCW